jgi:hypothetical protein
MISTAIVHAPHGKGECHERGVSSAHVASHRAGSRHRTTGCHRGRHPLATYFFEGAPGTLSASSASGATGQGCARPRCGCEPSSASGARNGSVTLAEIADALE